MALTATAQIAVIAADPLVAGSLVRRVREFGVSAVATATWPDPVAWPHLRGLIVASAGVVIPDGPQLPLLAVGDGFDALLRRPETPWRSLGRVPSGFATVRVDDGTPLWAGNALPFSAWFRRTRGIEQAPAPWRATAWDPEGRPVALDDPGHGRYAVQFHPQRSGSDAGRQMLRRFVRDLCGCVPDWRLPEQVPRLLAGVQDLAGDDPVVVLLSGGLASLVTAALAVRALGPDRVVAVHADTGLLRQGESERVLAAAQAMGLRRVALHDVGDNLWPAVAAAAGMAARESTVADCLLDLADQTAARIGGRSPVLAGVGAAWPGAGVVAPLQAFERSEWRQLGRALGLGDDVLDPLPFPLGGLAAWCDGPLTRARLNLLRQAEARVAADLFRLGDGTALTQAAVRLAVTATGAETLIIEAVRADDGLAAQPYEAVPGFWPEVAERLRSLMPGLRHVCLDLAPSPAGTLPG